MLKQHDVGAGVAASTTTTSTTFNTAEAIAEALRPRKLTSICQQHIGKPLTNNGNSDNNGIHHSNGCNGFDAANNLSNNGSATPLHGSKDSNSNCGNSNSAQSHCKDNDSYKDHDVHQRERQQLLVWNDMPKHLQFNPYIHTGYRPMLSFWGCIHSLLYFHNETINILTHAIPILYILLTVPDMLPWSASTTHWFLCWCHMLGLVCPWVGSFIYHLFMNLERNEKVYYRLLQVDMLGIWINQSFGALPMVTATTYCLPLPIRWFFTSAYVLMSIRGFYKAMTAWSPWERRLCFLFPFTIRMALLVIRSTSYGGGDPASYIHIVLEDLVSVIGAAIGAMHIPEKWYPGAVDLCLNSHNIMHVLVVCAVYSMHVSTVRDLHWMADVTCHTAPSL